MEKHTGEQLNKLIIEKLDSLLTPIFRVGELESRASTADIIDVKDRLGNDKKVSKDFEPKYRALMAFINALTFEETLDSEVFEIPGLKIGSDKQKMYIPVSKIESVANLIDSNFGSERKFEELTGIKLPNQIHQYRADRRGRLDGFDILAPSPKKLSETDEEYEARLKAHYGDRFVAPTMAVPIGEEERTLRVAYPHEKTDYRNGTSQVDGYYSESYYAYQNQQLGTRERSVRPRAGERIRVRESELAEEKIPLLTRLKAKASLVGKALQCGKFWKGVALAGGAVLGARFIAIPLALGPYGPMVIGLGGSVAFYALCKTFFERVKKNRDKRKAAEAVERERASHETRETPPVTETPPVVGEGPEEATPIEGEPDFEGMKRELLEQQRLYQEYQVRINNLRREIADPSISPEDKTAKEAEITTLQAQQREILTNQRTIIDTLYNGLERGRAR
jgi:hypothetical protein